MGVALAERKLRRGFGDGRRSGGGWAFSASAIAESVARVGESGAGLGEIDGVNGGVDQEAGESESFAVQVAQVPKNSSMWETFR